MSLSYPSNLQTIRPPVFVVDANNDPVSGLSYDAAGLVIEWRLQSDVDYTASIQTAEGWQELGNGFYFPTIVVGNQSGGTIEVRVRTLDYTSAPGSISFTEDAVGNQVIGTVRVVVNKINRISTDLRPINFGGFDSGSSLSATVSVDGSAFASVSGAISPATSIGTNARFTIDYDASDRPTGTGSAVYLITDGVKTVSILLEQQEDNLPEILTQTDVIQQILTTLATSSSVASLDTAIASVQTSVNELDPGDSAGVTELLSRLTVIRAQNLDNAAQQPEINSRLTAIDQAIDSIDLGDTAGISTLLERLTDARATLLDKIADLDNVIKDGEPAEHLNTTTNERVNIQVSRVEDPN